MNQEKRKILLFNPHKNHNFDLMFDNSNPGWDSNSIEELINLVFCFEPIEVTESQLADIKRIRHPYILLGEKINNISDTLTEIVKEAEQNKKEAEEAE